MLKLINLTIFFCWIILEGVEFQNNPHTFELKTNIERVIFNISEQTLQEISANVTKPDQTCLQVTENNFFFRKYKVYSIVHKKKTPNDFLMNNFLLNQRN